MALYLQENVLYSNLTLRKTLFLAQFVTIKLETSKRLNKLKL